MSDTSYMVSDYPSPPEETVICCPFCGDELSNEVYELYSTEQGVFACENCFNDYIEELTKEELADLIGIRHKSRHE